MRDGSTETDLGSGASESVPAVLIRAAAVASTPARNRVICAITSSIVSVTTKVAPSTMMSAARRCLDN